MFSIRRTFVCLVISVASGAAIHAQTSLPPAEVQWSALKSAVTATVQSSPVQPGQASGGLTRAQNAANFVSLANQLKEFHTRNPTHSTAIEAKQLEALCLNRAAVNGNTSEDVRRTDLIKALGNDPRSRR
jgi:hypothetical protein